MKKTNSFKFKQFEVIQNKAAMKIGTDAVLLGAWANVNKATNVLDIGTGTGILSLQIAQRNQNTKITAIEIDHDAYSEAKENFQNSPWSNRLECVHQSLEQYNLDKKNEFDFIICNPPYYNSSYLPTIHKRAQARHKKSLGYDELISSCEQLLSSKGQAAFIIPIETENKFLLIAKNYGFSPIKVLHVRGNIATPIKRSLIQLSKENNNTNNKELAIEIKRHVYTQKYITIVKEFYLKM